MTDQSWGTGWPTRQQEWLLHAAVSHGERAIDGWRRWKESVDIDQLDGPSQGMLPLAQHNIARLGISDPLLSFCTGFYRRVWYLNNLNFHHMTGVLRSLHEVGIRKLLLLKGAAMALGYYRDYGLRPMGDFDFQIPLDQAPAVPAMLVDWGWRPQSPLPRPHGWDFRDPENRKLDVHWYSLYACTAPGIDDEFWASAIDMELGGVPVAVLCPTDQLLHVLVHGIVFLDGANFRWVMDAMTILRLEPANAVNWHRFVNAARRRAVVPIVYEGLRYLSSRFGAAIPAWVLESLAPPPVAAEVAPPPVRRGVLQRVHVCWRTHGAAEVVRRAVRKAIRGSLRSQL